MRRAVAVLLRWLASRIDGTKFAPAEQWSFTIEPNVGVVFRQDGRGCPLLVDTKQVDRAHTEAGWGGYRFYVQNRREEKVLHG